MTSQLKKYSPELVQVLADILTSGKPHVRALLDASGQADALEEAFSRFAQSRPAPAQRWRESSLALLPRACWKAVDGGHRAVNVPGASLKYMNPSVLLRASAADPQFVTRGSLCQALFSALTPQQAARYGAMLRWGPLVVPDPRRHEGLHDVALADAIYLVEQRFHRTYALLEAQEFARSGRNLSQPTTAHTIRDLSDQAQTQTYLELERIASKAEAGPDDLVVRTLCHMAANRALAESARLEELSHQVKPALQKVLSALNAHGHTAVPEVADDSEIRAWLQKWFGRPDKRGEPGPLAQALGRTHTGEQLEHTLLLAGQLQDEYIATRGSGMGRQRAVQAFGNARNKMLFALVLVACYYSGEKVRAELFGAHNLHRTAYPGPKVRTQPLGAHSLELFKSVFGHIAFSNSGWAISTDGIESYSRAAGYKRSAFQELVFMVFKLWHPQQVLALHRYLLVQWQALAVLMPAQDSGIRVASTDSSPHVRPENLTGRRVYLLR